MVNSILQVLCNAVGFEVSVPPGSRDNSQHEDTDEPDRVDCLKAALLEAPDYMLSPEGKRRVREVIPEHEITYPHLDSLLRNKVKTSAFKRVKKNIHDTAMTSSDVMIGVFYSGQRKHCVLIDGSDGDHGSISDPVEGYGKRLVRSKRTSLFP